MPNLFKMNEIISKLDIFYKLFNHYLVLTAYTIGHKIKLFF